MRRMLVAIAVLISIPAVAYAGGGGVDTSGCAGYSEGTTVAMRDSCFAGTAHFAPSDSTITVTNEGQLPHTLTAVDGSFDTGQVAGGGSAQLTFDEPGIYRVFCSLHGTPQGEGMAGVVVVGEPEPGSVALPMDTSAFSAAVASETDRVISAIEDQDSTIGAIDDTQAELLAALGQMDGGESAALPQVVTMPGEVDPAQLVVLVLVGLAAGLALAALLTVLRLRIAQASSARLDRFESSVEA